jgi:hypothetical protein
MAAKRRAEATWEGDLLSGKGVVSASTSRTFTELPVSWASRTESADGRTSPEELVAAALRQMSQAHEDQHAFLVAAGKELAVLLSGQFNQLRAILGRIRE